MIPRLSIRVDGIVFMTRKSVPTSSYILRLSDLNSLQLIKPLTAMTGLIVTTVELDEVLPIKYHSIMLLERMIN
jgi:hypothetical protein